jgi:hypothetical protein
MNKEKQLESINKKIEAHENEEKKIKDRMRAIEILVHEAKKEYDNLKLEIKIIEGKKLAREEDKKELE